MLNMLASREINISPKIIEAMNEAQTFVGKTKREVLNRYGEPDFVRYDVLRNSSIRKSNEYDEAWFYRYDAGTPIIAPNQYGIEFYFINDVVMLVTG